MIFNIFGIDFSISMLLREGLIGSLMSYMYSFIRIYGFLQLEAMKFCYDILGSLLTSKEYKF